MGKSPKYGGREEPTGEDEEFDELDPNLEDDLEDVPPVPLGGDDGGEEDGQD